MTMIGFNSRTPGGVRPKFAGVYTRVDSFNSRTPGGVRRAGFDLRTDTSSCFNSRTPGGVRLTIGYGTRLPRTFQFTHPGRGATCSALTNCYTKSVSIHAPREGCDKTLRGEKQPYKEFQFTHPGRGATNVRTQDAFCSVFQFTHPGRGATIAKNETRRHKRVSIHAPREGCDCTAP